MLLRSLVLVLVILYVLTTTGHAAVTYRFPDNFPLRWSDPIRLFIDATNDELTVGKSYVRLSNSQQCKDEQNITVTHGLTPSEMAEYASPGQHATFWAVQFPSLPKLFYPNKEQEQAGKKPPVVSDRPIYVCLNRNGLAEENFEPLDSHSTLGGGKAFRYWGADIPIVVPPNHTPRPGSLEFTIAPTPFPTMGNDIQVRGATTIQKCVSGSNQEITAATYASNKVTLSISNPGTYYLCMKTHDTNGMWSAVPIGYTGSNLEPSLRYDALDESNLKLTVYPSGTTATFSCEPKLVAGVESTCTITVTSGSTSPIKLTDLRDGSGVEVCPLPALTPNGNSAWFKFTPARDGRDGFISASVGEVPLLFDQTNNFYYEWSALAPEILHQNNHRTVKTIDVDERKARFSVYPSPTILLPYNHQGKPGDPKYLLGKISQFNGVGGPTMSVVQLCEQRFATSATSCGTDLETAVGPTKGKSFTIYKRATVSGSNVRICRFRIPYYFNASSVSLRSRTFIGRVELFAGEDNTKFEKLFRSFTLYSYFRQVIVTGGDATLSGDPYIVEQLVAEHIKPNDGAYYYVIRLTASAEENPTLYFLQPYLTCDYNDAFKTDPQDIAALKQLYEAHGSEVGKPENWKKDNFWRGDPCFDNWQGVVCRNNRVVALELPQMGWKGAWSANGALINGFSKLERLDLEGNKLSGAVTIPTGWVSLRELNVKGNAFTSVEDTTFTNRVCLRKFVASFNELTSIPNTRTNTGLETLDVSNNVIVGAIGSWNLPTLRYLNLAKNKFTGTLPSLPFSTIQSVDVSHNALTGQIPEAYTNFKKLQFLDFSYNQLEGKVPVTTLRALNKGMRVSILGAYNFFTHLTPLVSVQKEGWTGNYFVCPLPAMYEAQGYNHYTDPMMCDWESYGVLPGMTSPYKPPLPPPPATP